MDSCLALTASRVASSAAKGMAPSSGDRRRRPPANCLCPSASAGSPILEVVGFVVISLLVAPYASIGRGDLLDVTGREVAGELDKLRLGLGGGDAVMARTLE